MTAAMIIVTALAWICLGIVIAWVLFGLASAGAPQPAREPALGDPARPPATLRAALRQGLARLLWHVRCTLRRAWRALMLAAMRTRRAQLLAATDALLHDPTPAARDHVIRCITRAATLRHRIRDLEARL